MRRKTWRRAGRARMALLALLALLLATAGIMLTPAAALAQERDAVVVPEGSRATLVVVADGNARVEGTAETVIAASGDVIVAGTVRGMVLAADGQVRVLAGGRVEGDAYSSVRPVVEPGGTVTGAVDTIDVGRAVEAGGNLLGTLWWLATTAALLGLTALLTWALPRAFDLTVANGTDAIGPSALTGALLALGLPVLAVVLAVTVIGIPLAVALVLMLVPLYVLGQIAAAWILGVQVLRRRERRVLVATAGMFLLQIVAVVPVLGLLAALASMYGLGALAVTTWRATRTAPRTPAGPGLVPGPAASA